MNIKDLYKALVLDRGEDDPIHTYLLRFSDDDETEAVLHLDIEKHPELNLDNRLEEGRSVEMWILFGSQGISCYSGKVSYVLGERLHISNIEFVNRIQRRNDVKAPMIYEGTIRWLTNGGRQSQDEVERLKAEANGVPYEAERWESTVVFQNISSGGVGFRVPATEENLNILKKGNCYGMWFDKCDEPFFISFELIRIEPERGEYVNCGGRFIAATARQEMMIRRYVFRVETGEKERRKQVMEIVRGKRSLSLDNDIDDKPDEK